MAQKIIQENLQQLKDELPDGLSTRAGIKMAPNVNKSKMSVAKLRKF